MIASQAWGLADFMVASTLYALAQFDYHGFRVWPRLSIWLANSLKRPAALAALKLRGIRVPTLLRRVVTLLLLVYAGQLLFWPPAMEHGVVSSLIANTQAGILQLTTAMRAVLPPR